MSWTKEPTGPGLYWVYHIDTRGIGTASVYEVSDGLRVRIQGLERVLTVEETRGRLLYFPANVPVPPSGLVYDSVLDRAG